MNPSNNETPRSHYAGGAPTDYYPSLALCGSRANQSPDIRVENHGSIFLFRPLTPAATAWMEEHCPAGNDHQYFAAALCVEPRYVFDLIDLAHEGGLTV